MEKNNEDIESLKEENLNLKQFGKRSYDLLTNELDFTLKRIKDDLDRLATRYNIEIEEKQQKVI